jgi:hypothetical protein
MIQRYLGETDNGLLLWEDTVWETLEEACEAYPEVSYRKIRVTKGPIPEPESFVATAASCNLQEWAESRYEQRQ